MPPKTGGGSVLMEKGKKRDRYMMEMKTSMDVKASPKYSPWHEKVNRHDEGKLKSNKNKLEEQY